MDALGDGAEPEEAFREEAFREEAQLAPTAPLARARRREETRDPRTAPSRSGDPTTIDAGASGEDRGRDRSPPRDSSLAPSFAPPAATSATPLGEATLGERVAAEGAAAGASTPGAIARWRRASVAGAAGIVRCRVSRSARRTAGGAGPPPRDQLELEFEGSTAAPAPAAMPYSVVLPFPSPNPTGAKPRRLITSRAVPTAHVVPEPVHLDLRRSAGRWVLARLRELRSFLAPPAANARLQPVLTSGTGPGRSALAPLGRRVFEQSVFEESVFEESALGGRSEAPAAAGWVEQIALVGGLLAAIALAWYLG